MIEQFIEALDAAKAHQHQLLGHLLQARFGGSSKTRKSFQARKFFAQQTNDCQVVVDAYKEYASNMTKTKVRFD